MKRARCTRGRSEYPIKSGSIIRLETPLRKVNKHLKARFEHTVYIWVMRELKRTPKGMKKARDKERPVRALFCYVPPENKMKVVAWGRSVQFEYLTKLMKKFGFTVVATDCRWWGDPGSFKRFYNKIGLYDNTPVDSGPPDPLQNGGNQPVCQDRADDPGGLPNMEEPLPS